MLDFAADFDDKMRLCEDYLVKCIDSRELNDLIAQPMKYVLLGGGKRLRPVLMLAAYELAGGRDFLEILPFAAALECIHAYSLTHDDLPCMDDDEFRRGRPTCHIVYGEATAVLTGDSLLNFAYELLLANINGQKKHLAAAQIIAEAAGSKGMILGQCLDLAYEGKQLLGESQLFDIHFNKTSKLIEAAMLAGGAVAGAGVEQMKALKDYAINLGLAFQICDDILDIEGDSAVIGKPTGSDAANDKLTFPKLFGLDKSKELLVSYSEKAKRAIESFGNNADFLIQMIDFLANRDK